MAVPSETLLSYGTVGIREDLSDVIYDVAPDETPLLSTLDQATAKQKTHEWQTDTLDTPSADNEFLEGDDFAGTAANVTTRLNNILQISKKEPVVSGSNESYDAAGRGSEMEYQIVQKGRALKTDIEKSMFANKAKNAGNASTARIAAGIPAWLTSNTDFDAGGADPTGDGSDTRTDSGTTRAFAETQFTGVLESIFDSGGNPDQCFLAASKKTTSNAFVGAATEKNIDVGTRTVINVVAVYESDFSTSGIAMIPSRHVRSRDVIIVENQFLGFATAPGRNMVDEELGKTGDNTKHQLICEWTLEMRNEAAHGGVYDLS